MMFFVQKGQCPNKTQGKYIIEGVFVFVCTIIIIMLVNPHVDSTGTHWPNSQQLKDHLSFPLALSLQPFANDHPLSSIPPESISEHRCQSCKAFINQLCFIRNEYDCSLCGCTNYLNQPIDIRRIELNSLSYRLGAPDKQRILTSKERLIAFVLDLTLYGQQSREYLLYVIHLIKEFVKKINENGIGMKFLLLGFDTAVHRFTLNSEEPTRLLTYGHHPEEDEIYFPSAEELHGHSIHSYRNIENTLVQLQEEVKKELRGGKGEGLVEALKTAMRLSKGYSGKVILVSGIREQPQEFKQKMNKFYYDVVQRHSFTTNRKECLKGDLQKMIQQTQMSLSFYFINAEFINNMPFHIMAKITNGELRHYYPNQSLLLFHNLQQSLQSFLDENTAYESLLKVRYSTGVKMVGLFGNFRPTKVTDQVDLLTCPTHRRYLFEFCIQGRITSDIIVVQFSSLYTDLHGKRFFIIETHSLRVSGSSREILDNINYINVNVSYVRGVIHNLDTSGSLRNIQLGLQQRCRKHITALREASKRQNQENQIDSILLKNVKPYIIITFLMMKHFLLNQNYQSIILFDLNTELRSKIATYDNCINVIWPLVYAVNQNGWEMTQMQEQYIPRGTVAIFIDRCDQYYCYLANPKLQAQIKTANFAKEILSELIEKEISLEQLRRVIQEVKRQKGESYIDILPIEDLRELKILDMGGQFGFDKFISVLVNE